MTSMPQAAIFSDKSISVTSIPDNNQELGDEITHLAGHINAAQYRFLKLLAALVERHAWGGDSGIKSPAHWLNYYCGIALGAAREKVRVAKALATLPLIDKHFQTGAISYSKVRAMTRSATPENEDYLLEIAKHGTAHHVETLVRKYRRAERLNKACEGKAQHEAREFSWYQDDDGMLVFRGKLPAEDGAVFLQAMEAVLQTSRSAGSLAEKPDEQASNSRAEADKSVPAGTDFLESPESELPAETFIQKRADALVMMSEHLLATLDQMSSPQLTPLAGGDKYQVMIHIDVNALNESDQAHQQADAVHCHLESGRFVSPMSLETTRRLACDASVVTVLEDGAGNVLDVGRKTRSIPPAIRRALKIRDGGCRYPGCCESRWVDGHHIQHWCDGGETSLDNLVLLCRYHHRLLHQDRFSIEVVSNNVVSNNTESAGTLSHRSKRASRRKSAARRSGRIQNLVFTNSAGKRIEQALFPQFRASEFSSPGARLHQSLLIETENADLGLDIDSQTAVTAWRGETMDYGMAVSALFARAHGLGSSVQSRSTR